MSIRPEEALRAKVASVSAITALIGSSPVRYYPNAAPQKATYPLIVADVEEDRPLAHLSGPLGWSIARIALRIYAHEYEACQDVAEQLRIALHSIKETVTVGVATCVPTIFLRSQVDTPAGLVEGSDKPVYGITQTYEISMAQATS